MRRDVLLAAAFLLAFTAVAYSPARATNFRGYDEWLNLSLLSQGIVDVPYANRPLNLVWGLPGWRLFADPLAGFLFFHLAWFGLTGLLTYLVARRLWPGGAAFAYLAATLAIVWAPGDRSRLCSAQMILYSGCTFGALLAVWLMLEAWSRRRLALAAAAVLAGATAVTSFEATLAPLGLVPLLFLVAGGARDHKRLARWTLAVLVLLGAGGVRFALPRWTAPERVAYQSGTAPDFTPGPLLDRTYRQLRRHVAPVLEVPPVSPLPPGSRVVVAAAVVVFLLGGALIVRRAATSGQAAAEPSAGALAIAASLGLLWALASYLPFVLNPETHGGERMEFLSTPGVAVLLAAGGTGAAALLRGRLRLVAGALLGAWMVAGGVARHAALQVEWDARSAYPDQRRSLLELTAAAPDVAPGTLVILLDGGWPIDVAFRHAVRFLYEGRAVGHDVNALAYLYETSFEKGGVRSVPRPVLNRPWREGPCLFPYDAVLVLRQDDAGRIRLLEEWPVELPALPPGAAYEPRSRIRLGSRLPRLAVLRRPR